MGFGRSLSFAVKGVGYVLRKERNARIHLLFAVAAILIGAALGVSGPELAAIFFAIIIVFLAEIFNTAIEKTLDLIEPNHHAQVAIIKDMAAGGVLVAALGAVIIGIIIFTPYILGLAWNQ